MLRTIHFYGPYEERFGIKTMKLDVDTPRTMVNGLISQVKGFRKQLEDDPRMSIVLTDADGNEPSPLRPEEVDMSLGKATDIHFMPAIEGAGIETAVMLEIAAWGASAAVAQLAAYVVVHVAAMVVLGAITRALAPSPSTSAGAGRPGEAPSFIYNGAVNVVEQGYAVPLVFGVHTVGSIVVSAGVSVEEIGYTSAQSTRPDANHSGSPSRESYQY